MAQLQNESPQSAIRCATLLTLSELDYKLDNAPRLTAYEAKIFPYIALGLAPPKIERELSSIDSSSVLSMRLVAVIQDQLKTKFGIESKSALIKLAMRYCERNNINYKALLVHSAR